MKEHLGEFEELILLLIMTLKEEAYGLSIRRTLKSEVNRTVTIGAVHGTLNRLESKGFVESSLSDPTELRGGRRKRLFTITATGKNALQKSKAVKVNLWSQIPDFSLGES